MLMPLPQLTQQTAPTECCGSIGHLYDGVILLL